MKRIYGIPLGRLAETLATLDEATRQRSAYKAGNGAFSDYTIQTWPNRPSMAKSIRMQERGVPRQGFWKAVVALTPGEGY